MLLLLSFAALIITPIVQGVLWVSSHGDDRMIFWGLKFSIPGYFLGRQIWQVYDFFFNLKIRGSDRLGLRMKYNQTC